MSEMRERAEALWEELGGDLCICQNADVPHWCEKCQGRIDLICSAFQRAAQADEDEDLTCEGCGDPIDIVYVTADDVSLCLKCWTALKETRKQKIGREGSR
jgi:hypothetical protein